MVGEVLGEGLQPPVAAELGETRERRSLERQPLRLLVGDHLQPMLDTTQDHIGLAQVLDRFAVHPSFGAEFTQHVERARTAHLRAAAAEDKLLSLNKELDLANAAAPQLEVMAGHDDAVVAAHGMDLALHRVNVGDRGVVEILAPDEWREFGQEALAEREIARRRARLDQRRALPILAERFVIGVRAQGRQRHRRRAGIGPQAQIDPQHIALAGALLKDARQRLGDAHEQRRGFCPLGDRRRRGVVEHDQVDVA